jgi:hypothetical protein
MLFKGIIAVYSENHIKPINALCGQKCKWYIQLPLDFKGLTELILFMHLIHLVLLRTSKHSTT